jgi:hypothetical protein
MVSFSGEFILYKEKQLTCGIDKCRIKSYLFLLFVVTLLLNPTREGKMKIVATLALYKSFEELQLVGGKVDIPTATLAEGLYLAMMYDDGYARAPQHMLAVAVGDDLSSQWQVTHHFLERSPVGNREIVTVEFDPDAVPLYVGMTRVIVTEAAAQQAMGIPIYEVHSLYSPSCRCVCVQAA